MLFYFGLSVIAATSGHLFDLPTGTLFADHFYHKETAYYRLWMLDTYGMLKLGLLAPFLLWSWKPKHLWILHEPDPWVMFVPDMPRALASAPHVIIQLHLAGCCVVASNVAGAVAAVVFPDCISPWCTCAPCRCPNQPCDLWTTPLLGSHDILISL